ncbi:MAG: ABC transporter ATP-binding protein [Clostridium sp.]|nr:ABC transporter ATP-binding protein [Clostridium sp.]
MAIIKVKNVSKNYGEKKVLDDISIEFEENKIYGLLGRNGAGKTTLLNLITDRISLDVGKITIDDEGIYENDVALEKVYYMTEKNLYPDDYKIKDVFKWTKVFYQNFDNEYALQLSRKFDIDINKKIKNLSTGYNTVCKIITTLASGAEILIFDEPVLGLDANHREIFYKELMKNYIEQPKTIILSTHIIEEVSNLLEKVIIIKNSKIITSDNCDELLEKSYTVSGLSQNVDKFIKSKKAVNSEEIAAFKEVTILGKLNSEDKILADQLELKFSKVQLQKLFIYLTEKEGA